MSPAGQSIGPVCHDARSHDGDPQARCLHCGGERTAAKIVEANPHRTVAGALYQIDMRLKKKV